MFKTFAYSLLVLTAGVVAAMAWTNAPRPGTVQTSAFSPAQLQVDTSALREQEIIDRSVIFVKE